MSSGRDFADCIDCGATVDISCGPMALCTGCDEVLCEECGLDEDGNEIPCKKCKAKAATSGPTSTETTTT